MRGRVLIVFLLFEDLMNGVVLSVVLDLSLHGSSGCGGASQLAVTIVAIVHSVGRQILLAGAMLGVSHSGFIGVILGVHGMAPRNLCVMGALFNAPIP